MLNKASIKFPFIYGLLASILAFIFILFLYKIMLINPLGGKKEIAFVFVILAMILAVYKVRDANGGAISLREAYGVGFFTTLIFSIFSLVLLYIFLNYIGSNALAEYITTTETELIKNKAQIIKNGISEQAYSDALNGIKKTNTQSILMDDFIKKIFLGIIPSFMIALYYRRKFIN